MADGIERSNVIIKTFLLLVLISILTALSGTRIKGHFFGWDPLENTIGSISLINTGTIADESGKPTNLREPVPIIIHAAYLKLFTNINFTDDILSIISYKENRAAISRVNLVYVWLVMFGVMILSVQMTSSYKVAFVAILLSWFYFLNSVQHLYSPHTEIIASVFLVFISISIIMFYRKPKFINAALVGITLGLLSLTKLPATYVAMVIIVILSMVVMIKGSLDKLQLVKILAILLLSFSMILLPWVLRNHYLSKEKSNVSIQSSITQRGGNVLNGRAKLTNKVLNDLPGYLFVYAPMVIKEQLFINKLGFKRSELWPGSKYDVRKYDRPDSRFTMEAAKAGHLLPKKNNKPNKELSINHFINPKKLFIGDQESKRNGMDIMKSRPLDQLLSSLVFAWRGMWSFAGNSHPPESYSLYHVGNSFPSVILNFFCFLSLLVMPVLSIINKKMEWFLFSIFSVGFFWIYALFSHFIPRYSAPLIPISIISFLLILRQLYLNCIGHKKL